jgi:hypothetical protein
VSHTMFRIVVAGTQRALASADSRLNFDNDPTGGLLRDTWLDVSDSSTNTELDKSGGRSSAVRSTHPDLASWRFAFEASSLPFQRRTSASLLMTRNEGASRGTVCLTTDSRCLTTDSRSTWPTRRKIGRMLGDQGHFSRCSPSETPRYWRDGTRDNVVRANRATIR